MAERIPPEVQNLIAHLQRLQEELNMIRVQRQSVELELREVIRVIDSIKDLPDDEMLYESVGHILIKRRKVDVQRELEDRRDILELRLKTLSRQEAHLQKQVEELRKRITETIRQKYGELSALTGGSGGC